MKENTSPQFLLFLSRFVRKPLALNCTLFSSSLVGFQNKSVYFLFEERFRMEKFSAQQNLSNPESEFVCTSCFQRI